MPPIRRTPRPEGRPPRRTVAGRGPQASTPQGPQTQEAQPRDVKSQDVRPKAQDTKPQDAQPQETKSQETKPQETKPQEPKVTRVREYPEDGSASENAEPATDKPATAGPEAAETETAPPDTDALDTGTLDTGTLDTDTLDTDTAGSDKSARSRRIPPLAAAGAALAVLGLAAGIFGASVLVDPSSDALDRSGVDDKAFLDQPATDEVVTAATSDVQRLVAIDHATLDRYHDTLGEFLAPNLVEELEKSWPTLKSTYEQSKMKVDAKVSDVGVSFLSGDQAEVLIVQDISTSRDGQATGSTTGTYLIKLARIDGVWKLSEIPDLPS